MRLGRLPLIALLAAASAAFGAPASGPSRLFTGADLFGLEVATDPQISPDGKMIAYVRQSNDIMTDRARSTIWLIDVVSGRQSPLVAGPGSHASPRWSPDGTRLAYVSTGEGSAQFYVRWMGSGAAARVTGLANGPSSIAWSPDGARIAYVMFVPGEAASLGAAPAKPEGAAWADPLQVIDALAFRSDGAGEARPGYSQIFEVAAEGGAPIQLTFGPHNAGGPLSWTPDGGAILFSADLSKDWERRALAGDIHSVSLPDGAIRDLTHHDGPDTTPAVSPDGREVAYVGFDDRRLGYQNTRLTVMGIDGGDQRVLTASLDRSVDDPVWAADGKSVYVDYEDHGDVRVARVGLDGSVRTVARGLAGGALDRPYDGGAFSVARDGTLAVTTGDSTRPADISVVRGGIARRLTRLNEALLAPKALARAQPLPVTAFDGRPIDAWIMTPPGFDRARKYPMILEIHGGPFSAYGPRFSTDDQLYAAAGYVVLFANPRGSTGYGEDFANQIDKAYPGRDYDDLMSAVDAAIATGFVDPKGLFVTGGSGGGALTAWIVGKTGRFKAAAAQKPVIDWASFALTSDLPALYSPYWFAKKPWEDPQGYWARSPLSLVGNVRTPTLVVVGSRDYRTPMSEAEQYYTALKLRGVPTALVVVPGANHGGLAARPSQSAEKAAAILAWFARYRGQPAGAAPLTERYGAAPSALVKP